MYSILNALPAYANEAKDMLARLGSVAYRSLTQEELLEYISAYDIAVIGLGLRFDAEVLARASKLKMIATVTTGLDHIDLEYAKECRIEIISLRGENEFLDTITGTAELATGLMIACMRGIVAGCAAVQRYEWDREKFRGHTLYGKTLGIVGLGRLGKMMARYGMGFGMNVIAYDTKPDKEFCEKSGVRVVDFATLLSESDVISIHVHLTNETRQMFNATAFGKMRESAYLINTARGGIVNEHALHAALTDGRIAGYATDVLADELQFGVHGFASHPLIEYAKTHSNLVITPHIGGMTHESRVATDIFIAQKILVWVEQRAS